ncbi:MAG TPA: TMAO reductase system protein TorT [Noviherbaspirillum sp.]|nr:TMAO reductase system protein TorT [Noviherbaspirillum sp.]
MKKFLCAVWLATGVVLPLSSQAQQALTIGYATPELSSSFWISMTYGVESEARKLGVNLVKLNAGGDSNVNAQISQIQDLIERKVNAIIVGATNANGVKPVIESSIGKGIPVIGLSSIPNASGLSSAISADHYDMGRLQAHCLGKALNGKGAVALISQQQGQSWADTRRRGFIETIQKEYSGIRIVAESRKQVTRNGAINLVEDWLQRFPDINGIYNAVDDTAAGAWLAVKSAQKEGSVRIAASNLSSNAQQMLRNGELVCTSAQQIVTQGREALRQAVQAAKKEPTKPTIETPSILVDRNNLGALDLSLLTAPADYRP